MPIHHKHVILSVFFAIALVILSIFILASFGFIHSPILNNAMHPIKAMQRMVKKNNTNKFCVAGNDWMKTQMAYINFLNVDLSDQENQLTQNDAKLNVKPTLQFDLNQHQMLITQVTGSKSVLTQIKQDYVTTHDEYIKLGCKQVNAKV